MKKIIVYNSAIESTLAKLINEKQILVRLFTGA